ELLELGARTACVLGLSQCEHDLDESRKQARALERQGRRPLSSTDRGSRRIEPALSQTQLGQSRLWLPPEPARLLVGPLRGRELALETKKLSLPIPGQSGRRVPGTGETLPCAPGLFERLAPGAVELQDLRAMHEAAAGERDHLRLQGPPVGERSRPLPCAPHLVDLLAGKDDAAVDEPRHDR